MRRLICAAITVAAISTFGCNSISSTLVNRTDSDFFYGNSNGDPCRKCQTRPFKGVPITVRVPTHLDIAVKETVFLRATKDNEHISKVITPRPHLFVETQLIETDKVFTVDVKRPAAGTLDYSMTFGKKDDPTDDEQYFSEIKSTIVDKTINDINTSLQGILPLLRKAPTAKSTAAPGERNVFTENRIVAWKRFDLDAVDFELQITAFLEQQLNYCDLPSDGAPHLSGIGK